MKTNFYYRGDGQWVVSYKDNISPRGWSEHRIPRIHATEEAARLYVFHNPPAPRSMRSSSAPTELATKLSLKAKVAQSHGLTPILPWPEAKGVYFAASGREFEVVKIGRSKNIARRLVDIEMLNPYGVHLVAYIEHVSRREEFELHRRFRMARVHGEWFALTEPLRREILRHRRLMKR